MQKSTDKPKYASAEREIQHLIGRSQTSITPQAKFCSCSETFLPGPEKDFRKRRGSYGGRSTEEDIHYRRGQQLRDGDQS